jgi:hypothetical protein
MLAEKPKREQPRQRRRNRRTWGWFLSMILAGTLLVPMSIRGSGRMGGEQWTDLLLVMAMFCCAIALFYQLGLRLLAREREQLPVEVYEQQDESRWHDEDV